MVGMINICTIKDEEILWENSILSLTKLMMKL